MQLQGDAVRTNSFRSRDVELATARAGFGSVLTPAYVHMLLSVSAVALSLSLSSSVIHFWARFDFIFISKPDQSQTRTKLHVTSIESHRHADV